MLTKIEIKIFTIGLSMCVLYFVILSLTIFRKVINDFSYSVTFPSRINFLQSIKIASISEYILLNSVSFSTSSPNSLYDLIKSLFTFKILN